MVGHPGEDLPQSIFRRHETRAVSPGPADGLLEDDDLETLANAADIRRRAANGQGGLAHDQACRRPTDRCPASTGGSATPIASRSVRVSPFGSNSAILAWLPVNGTGGRGRTWREKESCWISPVLNVTVASKLVVARSRRRRQWESQGDAYLLTRWHVDFLAAGSAPGKSSDQRQSAVTVCAGIVDDDELLLDRLARIDVVLLAGEVRGRAADVGQQRPIVAQQGLCRPPSRSSPMRSKARSMRSYRWSIKSGLNPGRWRLSQSTGNALRRLSTPSRSLQK